MDATSRNDFFLLEHGFDNDISSLKIVEGLIVVMCIDPHCDNSHEWGNTVEFVGPYNAGYLIEGVNDWASHIRIYPYDPINEPRVSVFDGWRFEIGHAGTFLPGSFTNEDLKNHHIDKGGYRGAISSMYVPAGLFAEVFNNDNFRGESLTF